MTERGQHCNVESPDVRYALSGDAAIAYYVVGDGPRDLLFAPFMLSTVFAWELLPVFRDFCSRLAEFSRLILFDRRGRGSSIDLVIGRRSRHTCRTSTWSSMRSIRASGALRLGPRWSDVRTVRCDVSRAHQRARFVRVPAELPRAPGYPFGWTGEELQRSYRRARSTFGLSRPLTARATSATRSIGSRR